MDRSYERRHWGAKIFGAKSFIEVGGEARTPLAWIWSRFKGKLPQGETEPPSEPPVPLAWVWGQFKSELPQSESERRATQRPVEAAGAGWPAKDEAPHANLGGASSRDRLPDELLSRSLALASGREAYKQGKPTNAATPITEREKNPELSWLLLPAFVAAVAGLTWLFGRASN